MNLTHAKQRICLPDHHNFSGFRFLCFQQSEYNFNGYDALLFEVHVLGGSAISKFSYYGALILEVLILEVLILEVLILEVLYFEVLQFQDMLFGVFFFRGSRSRVFYFRCVFEVSYFGVILFKIILFRSYQFDPNCSARGFSEPMG